MKIKCWMIPKHSSDESKGSALILEWEAPLDVSDKIVLITSHGQVLVIGNYYRPETNVRPASIARKHDIGTARVLLYTSISNICL